MVIDMTGNLFVVEIYAKKNKKTKQNGISIKPKWNFFQFFLYPFVQ